MTTSVVIRPKKKIIYIRIVLIAKWMDTISSDTMWIIQISNDDMMIWWDECQFSSFFKIEVWKPFEIIACFCVFGESLRCMTPHAHYTSEFFKILNILKKPHFLHTFLFSSGSESHFITIIFLFFSCSYFAILIYVPFIFFFLSFFFFL